MVVAAPSAAMLLLSLDSLMTMEDQRENVRLAGDHLAHVGEHHKLYYFARE
jgi:hypothetical protein